MSREIKFRAFIPEEGLLTSDIFGSLSAFFMCVSDYCVDAEQYTGLKDKNGVEIYEGDVVLCANDVKWIVVYIDFEASFMLKTGVDSFNFDTFRGNIQIIGNIHEENQSE